jgi:antitoxin component of RelBE/YafQ-DinJ toxin-antitoxin module
MKREKALSKSFAIAPDSYQAVLARCERLGITVSKYIQILVERDTKEKGPLILTDPESPETGPK